MIRRTVQVARTSAREYYQYHELGRKFREMSDTLALAALKKVSLAEDKRKVRGGARRGALPGAINVGIVSGKRFGSRKRTSVCVLAQ